MKYYLVLCVVAMLVISGSGTLAVMQSNPDRLVKTEQCHFSEVSFLEGYTDVQIQLPETTSWVTTTEGYLMPMVTKVYRFPFETRIANVQVSFSNIKEMHMVKPVCLAPEPVVDENEMAAVSPSVGTLVDPGMPSFSYHLAAGTDGSKVVTYLAVHLYPVSYVSSGQTLVSATDATITVSYMLPELQPAPTTEYQLVIISPKTFSDALQPLVDFKDEKGITTKLVTTEDITQGTYFPVEGRDSAETMKYFIKDALDQWGTTDVMLVGGRKGGVNQETWWVPVRYSRLNDGSEGSYLTDLYFADIYDANGTFSSWDSNGNGIFAEWTATAQDILDMYPDVSVGRVACTSKSQVKIMVDKIITYESETYGSDWFKRFVGVAGDTYPSPNDTIYEGEMATNASYAQLEDLGFNASFLWTSTGTFTGPQSVIKELDKGCGFVHFSGHGNPMVWATHPPNNDTFLDGPSSLQMWMLTNGDKLPVVIVGGCHNNQFNTSLMNIIKGVLEDGVHYFSSEQPYGKFWYNEWIPRCWGWAMASQKRGGAIAVIANTGLGYGEPGINTLYEKGRFLEWLFFKAYHDGADKLGETFSMDLIYYMNEHPPMQDQIDCKIVQEWALLGDPSLQIGGYAS